MFRKYFISIILLSSALFPACTNKVDDSLRQGIELYNQNELESALPYLESAAEKFEANSETFAYLAETYRRLGMREDAMEAAQKALTIDSCNSFAHVTLSYLYNPMYGEWEMADREKAWEELMKGIDCNPDDGNLWLAIWTEAIFRGDYMMESKSLKMMIESGFLTKSILAYNRWMLRHLPPNSVLITNGDMDTYPAVALQETEGFRNDVTIINYSLLNTRWYQKHIEERYKLEFPLSKKELDDLKPFKDTNDQIKTNASQILSAIIKVKSENRFESPLAISLTVGDFGFAQGFEDHFVLMGAFKLWRDDIEGPNFDLDAIKSSLEAINIDDFTGPFVSAEDRSPVRTVYTKKISLNFTNLATFVIEEYIKQNNINEAMSMLQWANRANTAITKDPETTEKLDQLNTELANARS